MANTIFDMLSSQLGGETLDRISKQVGADPKQTAVALPGALGSLLGALAKNTQDSKGAEALAGALERDRHDQVFDRLGEHLENPKAANGAGILRHVLGGKREVVERSLGAASGMDASQASSMLEMLAPIVMGALGKAKRENGLDAGNLASMLGREREQLKRSQPDAVGGIMSSLLDTDGDGDVDARDLAQHGKGLLKKFFK